MSHWIVEGPDNGPLFIFAHGAGAGMEHDFMSAVANGLVEQGIRVVRFNFPYMVKRAEDGKKRPPDRAPKLLEAYEDVITHFTDVPVVIGGKSMGGRMSSLLADNELVPTAPLRIFILVAVLLLHHIRLSVLILVSFFRFS